MKSFILKKTPIVLSLIFLCIACTHKYDYWNKHYRNGNYIWKNNSNDGKWILESEFNKKNDGTYISFHNNHQHSYTTFKKGKRTGIYIDYYNNGKTKSIKHFKNDKREGKVSFYYKSGTLKQTEYYKNGIREGIVSYYLWSGALDKRGTVKNGKFDGTWKSYYPNGKVNVTVVYKNDTIIFYRRDTLIGKTKYIDVKHYEYIHINSK